MYAGVGVLANQASVDPSKVSYTLKGLLVSVEKLHFQRNFSRNFILVEVVCVLFCFIKPILGNSYVRSRGFIVREPRETHP